MDEMTPEEEAARRRARDAARATEEAFAADRREDWAASFAAGNAGRVRVEAALDIICAGAVP